MRNSPYARRQRLQLSPCGDWSKSQLIKYILELEQVAFAAEKNRAGVEGDLRHEQAHSRFLLLKVKQLQSLLNNRNEETQCPTPCFRSV